MHRNVVSFNRFSRYLSLNPTSQSPYIWPKHVHVSLLVIRLQIETLIFIVTSSQLYERYKIFIDRNIQSMFGITLRSSAFKVKMSFLSCFGPFQSKKKKSNKYFQNFYLIGPIVGKHVQNSRCLGGGRNQLIIQFNC